MTEDPLSVRPGVVILAVNGEGFGDEGEFARRVVEGEDDGSSMLPVRSRFMSKRIQRYGAHHT